ncbi:hypothetical protein DICVIV_02247 [Dictyocaulus viviparus]|uniref:Uncharacterized protein n=1 Tax=Dictyocaulus viviparus TaxID=29172 RepID=A0A0D8Y6J6_DICVI|nr:hypothetical protein DICVIV_02247 [Dictyocaulus viviparus]
MAKITQTSPTRSEPLFRQLMPQRRCVSPYYESFMVTMDRHNRRTVTRSSPQCQESRLRSLEAQVQNLRDQLRETSIRLGDTKTENERLRYLYNTNENFIKLCFGFIDEIRTRTYHCYDTCRIEGALFGHYVVVSSEKGGAVLSLIANGTDWESSKCALYGCVRLLINRVFNRYPIFSTHSDI